jgi:hypothetical protein
LSKEQQEAYEPTVLKSAYSFHRSDWFDSFRALVLDVDSQKERRVTDALPARATAKRPLEKHARTGDCSRAEADFRVKNILALFKQESESSHRKDSQQKQHAAFGYRKELPNSCLL